VGLVAEAMVETIVVISQVHPALPILEVAVAAVLILLLVVKQADQE
jgi:hypothetical protein